MVSENLLPSKKKTSIFIANCKDEFEVKCKVLEWFSRGAYKTEHYRTTKRNELYHNFMRNGINAFLGTNFNADDMAIIYTELGNGVNRGLCEQFINSGYDISVLKVGDSRV